MKVGTPDKCHMLPLDYWPSLKRNVSFRIGLSLPLARSMTSGGAKKMVLMSERASTPLKGRWRKKKNVVLPISSGRVRA